VKHTGDAILRASKQQLAGYGVGNKRGLIQPHTQGVEEVVDTWTDSVSCQ